MLHYSKKSLYWSFLIFVIWVSKLFGDKKIGFNSCEFIKFLNIANFHVFYVWRRRILSCNDATFLLHFFSFFWFCNATFFHSGYVIKPLQPSSAVYRAPPFTGNPHKLYQISHSLLSLLPLPHAAFPHLNALSD